MEAARSKCGLHRFFSSSGLPFPPGKSTGWEVGVNFVGFEIAAKGEGDDGFGVRHHSMMVKRSFVGVDCPRRSRLQTPVDFVKSVLQAGCFPFY